VILPAKIQNLFVFLGPENLNFMKKTFALLAVLALFAFACNPVDPEDEPTEKEKQMVRAEMTWQLDSMLVIYNYQSSTESREMLHADELDVWSYTFYPCTYRFPKDLCFINEMTGETFYFAKEYNKDFCKYICTYKGTVISAGYLRYYNNLFTMDGLRTGCWAEFMIREADTNWNTEVWTSTYNAVEDYDSGKVQERHVEYYSRR